MAKISVRHCVAQAYGLLFGQPFTLIGLTWLPALFYALATAWLIQRMDMAMAAAVPSGDGILGQYALFYFALLVVATALFGGTIAVSLTRQAFALREERVAAYLVIGARELRLFFALTRYYALTVMTLLVFATAAGIAVSQGTNYASVHGIGLVWLGVSIPDMAEFRCGCCSGSVVPVLCGSLRVSAGCGCGGGRAHHALAGASLVAG